jgi:cardiolipin synthase
MLTSLPNLLTLSRIIVIPIIIGLFFVREPWAAWTACVLFSAAAITDYVDGYLARSWSQVSLVGKFLDPIADKLLVAAVLFMLVAVDKLNGISVLPAVVILLREVLVSGLREFLAGIRVGMPVSKLAKWKTAIQMVALGILIVGNDGPPWLPVEAIGVVGLWAAGLLTLITGWDYMQAGWKHMNEEREPEPEPAAPRPAQPHGTGAARSVG